MRVDIRATRLVGQGLTLAQYRSPVDAVRGLLAVQAQDYPGSLWALGVRVPGSTEGAVEQAIADREIVRTWPLRGTLHFVAAEDARWLLQHLAPRVIASWRGRFRQLELEEADFARAAEVVAAALEGSRRLTRPALYALLDAAGISPAGQRGIHILVRLALEGLICFGSREGKQHTFVLMDDWLPPAPEVDREEALAGLARRYFCSRGPATIRDFAWWSGLNLTDARAAVDLAHRELARVSVDGVDYVLGADTEPAAFLASDDCHLLPPFDEYLVAYSDRSAVLDPADSRRINNGGGLLAPAIVIGGRVKGIWKRVLDGKGVEVIASPFRPLTGPEQESLALAVERYAAFLGRPLRLTVADAS